MNKQRARQLYELADRLSKLDVNALSEEQRQQRSTMIAKLQEEVKTIKEFAPGAGDGGEEETLHKYARMWYNGDLATQQQVEQVLARMGWEIGELESEEGGAFVIQAGDEHGDSYIGFTAVDLTEGIADASKDPGEYDQEGNMARQDLATAANAAEELRSILDSDENLPEWVQSKITKAVDYLDTVRDYMKSKDQDVTENSQRVDSLVTDALRIMKGAEVSDAVQALKTVLGDREYNGRRGHYNFYVRQILDMYNQQGVAEGSDNITAVFSGYGNYMSGRGANIFKHYGITVLDKQYFEDEDIAEYTVSGSKEALDQARAYLERSDQFGGMILKQGVTETKKPSPKLTPVNIKKTDPVSEEINTEAYERLQKVFAFKNYES
jgi:hypothetical protein